VTAEQRRCPACDAEFTWTSASPRQRFCSTRCRQSWWCARRRQATAALTRHDPRVPPRAEPRATAYHDHRGDTARTDAPGGILAAVPACPHCAKPVAVVAWLVPPAASSVATPPRHAATIHDSQ
jgi:endogenous inhibitor of DNA gyrase (YacG/DUF329 family)